MDPFVFKKVDVRKRVYSVLGRMEKTDVVKHFQTEGVPRRTIYNIIKRYESGLPYEDKPRQGHPAKLNKQQLQKLKNNAENHVGTSQRKLEKKFEVSRPCTQRILKKIGLKHYKRQCAPKYTRKQLEQIPGKCRKLRRELTDQETFIIVDDEKYFTFSGEKTFGNAGFYSSNRENTPDDVKFKSKQKFKPKILVWLALSSTGI